MRRLTIFLYALLVCVLVSCNDDSTSPGSEKPKESRIFYTALQPDGKNGTIYSIKPDGTDKRSVHENVAMYSAPAAGRLGVMRRISETEWDVALLDTNGTFLNTIVSIVGASAGIKDPILSPTANKLLYRIGRYNGSQQTTEIHIVNVDGTNDILLEANAAHEHIPVFSPDGTKVAYFIRGENDAQSRSRDQLWIINADGTGRRQLINEAKSINDGFESLDWSPDGTKIVCLTESVDNGYDIIVVDVDDAEIHQITTDHLLKLMPVFSPDSKKIAFCNGEEVDGVMSVGISIIDVDGANRRHIAISTVASTMYPRWSPDGKNVVVTELNVGTPDPVAGTLKIVNVATGNITVLDQSVYKAYWAKP